LYVGRIDGIGPPAGSDGGMRDRFSTGLVLGFRDEFRRPTSARPPLS
jgi:hypothetical protein